MNNQYEIAIIGAGMAGSIAATKISQITKNTKVIIFDSGRPPAKRRQQTSGWLGCLPSSDGKFYQNDVDKIANLVGIKKAKSSNNWISSYFNEIFSYKTTKDKSPHVGMIKKLNKLEWEFSLNNFNQVFPKDIHMLSRDMAKIIEENKNISMSFDNEIFEIYKQKNMFVIKSQEGDFFAKKILMSVGRSGWRWVNNFYKNMGIIESNDSSKIGIKIEVPSSSMKEFNKSNCELKKNNIEIGPLCWSGTVIPEDHVDMTISAFRSNEPRWKTDKVSFSFIGDIENKDNGVEQADRLAKLTFILSNDRIMKERVSTIMNKKSKISIMKEYDFLITAIKDAALFMPEIITKGYFYVPTIIPLCAKINIGNNLETEIPGLFVAGESAGITGLLSAAIMGNIAGTEIVK